MSDFNDRMKSERDELRDRTEKLGRFIGGAVFNTLGAYERRLLEDQHTAMTNYLQLLSARLVLHGVQ